MTADAADGEATRVQSLASILALGRVEKPRSSKSAPEIPTPQMVEEQLEMVNTFTQLRQEEWQERRKVIEARARYDAERELMVASDLAQAVVFEGSELRLARRQEKLRRRRDKALEAAAAAGIEVGDVEMADADKCSSGSTSSRSRSRSRSGSSSSSCSSSSDEASAQGDAEVRIDEAEVEALKEALLRRAREMSRRFVPQAGAPCTAVAGSPDDLAQSGNAARPSSVTQQLSCES
mmetsp:Transcript_46562/g.104358  ORF Transcript_46562/g.104358 Transcript_46562/m.104358 type:complete len:236 (-) Transcript_46562:22-729(-)